MTLSQIVEIIQRAKRRYCDLKHKIMGILYLDWNFNVLNMIKEIEENEDMSDKDKQDKIKELNGVPK